MESMSLLRFAVSSGGDPQAPRGRCSGKSSWGHGKSGARSGILDRASGVCAAAEFGSGVAEAAGSLGSWSVSDGSIAVCDVAGYSLVAWRV